MKGALAIAFIFVLSTIPLNTAENVFFSMPFSNGYSSAIYDTKEKAVTAFTDMIEWYWSPAKERKNMLRRAYLGLKFGNRTIWLNEVEPESTEYLNESGIVHVSYKQADCYYFAPFVGGEHTIALVCDSNADAVLLHAELLDPGVKITKRIEGNRTTIVLSLEPVDGISLENEIEFWEDFHSVEPQVSEEYEKLFRQSTAFLKMGQSAESGAILAGLIPGRWTIAWVRDCCYSIKALIDSNHLSEAKKALEFLLNGEAGSFKHFNYKGKDYGIGEDYLISVCRYFGDGSEWSDDIDQQEPEPVENMKDPNIELDGFGLFLWVANEYVKKSGDKEFLEENMDKLKLVGENILHSIDENNLIREDSSIWERHLSRARHYLYTSITCAKGLESLCEMCPSEGISEFEEGYARLRKGISASVDEEGVLKGNIEEEKYYDAAVIEAINFGLVNESVAESTMSALEKELFDGKGFKRNDDGDWYDEQEWIFIDLRAAEAYLKLGEREKAIALIDRINSISAENFNIIAELYDENENYAGQVPMCGYGAGVFVSAVLASAQI